MRSFHLVAVLAATLCTVCGCSIFRNQQSPGGYVDDSAITARVRTALVKDPRVKASEIGVHTYEGKVTLNGVVDDADMARLAERHARETQGVRSVESVLQIAEAEPPLAETAR
jgi:osmotically-inducible protein OsmY